LHQDADYFADSGRRFLYRLVSAHNSRLTLLLPYLRELLWAAAVDVGLAAVLVKWRGCKREAVDLRAGAKRDSGNVPQ
jgi:hypothetical protein